MFKSTRIFKFVPAFCALLIVLRLTVLKSSATSDLSLGSALAFFSGFRFCRSFCSNQDLPDKSSANCSWRYS